MRRAPRPAEAAPGLGAAEAGPAESQLAGRSPGPARPDPVRKGLVLGICSLSLFMTYLDTTVLNVALPTIQRDLHAGLAGLQWIVDAYMLVLASLLMLSGSVGDRFGRRRVFRLGLLAFSAGSLLCSLAPSLDALIAFRVLQAAGGSMLTPTSLSIVRTTFTDPAERARAIGIWSAVFGLAAACGPVLGGVLVDLVGWRSVFWVNLPVGAAAFVAAKRYLPESRAAHPRRFDPLGQLLVLVGLATLTYAVIQGPAFGFTSPLILTLFGVAALSLTAFLVVERRQSEPLLELRFFRSPPFSGAFLIAVLSFVVLAGFLFVNTLYLQEVRGDSPLVAGLSTLPATGMIALSAPVAGRLTARHGPGLPMTVAGASLALGGTLLVAVTATVSYLVLAAAYLLVGLGSGLINPPITNTAVSGMPPAQAGVASAVTSASRQLGNVIGVAVMGAMLTTGLRSFLRPRLAALHLAPAAKAALLHAGVGAAGGLGLHPDLRAHPPVVRLVHEAFSAATHGPWILAAACGAACVLVALATTSARARAVAATVYRDPSHDSVLGRAG
jgi:EmrB/QacA subfamily drug resistance transporter